MTQEIPKTVCRVCSFAAKARVSGRRRQRTHAVDDSLMAIVVLVMVAWEFIQRVIPEKTREECITQRDAGDEERILESPSPRDMQQVDCCFSQRTNE
jgi:hypothetical protein